MRGHVVELRALRYFVTVAEELHFGRAAARLNIAQPAVSQQVARLERELGTRLLDRSSRTVRLTEAGCRVLDAARDTLAAAERVQVAAHRTTERVRIGTAPGLASRLESGIDRLRGPNASFEVELVDLPVPQRLNALRRGELDLALVRGVLSAPGLRVLPAWSEPLHAVVSTRHPLGDRDVVTLAEMAGYVLRLPQRGCDVSSYDAVTTALREADVHPELGRPTGSVQDALIEIGTDPRTWTLLPADAVTHAGATRVRAIPLDPPVSITGSVVTAGNVSDSCVRGVVAAFV
jgi:DNA-binding transcriptional LysR family regulator